ncbi:MAG TPA: hypothetical protein VME45_00010 [Stellaceae bacterium]|nr:hypothetical protein [Stellaceae bacterium]
MPRWREIERVGLPLLSRCARFAAALLLLVLAACAETGATALSGSSSDFIVVGDFAVPPGVVRLDPTMGFSLYRGEPGVPARQRAASIGRAVDFLVTDTIVDRLRALGYDAVSTSNPNPVGSGHRALIVSGTFRTIGEGSRRRAGDEHSAVIADVAIKAELPGGRVQPVQSFTVDSRSAPRVRDNNGATSRETGVDADATNVGAEIARVVGEVARRNNWLPARR